MVNDSRFPWPAELRIASRSLTASSNPATVSLPTASVSSRIAVASIRSSRSRCRRTWACPKRSAMLSFACASVSLSGSSRRWASIWLRMRFNAPSGLRSAGTGEGARTSGVIVNSVFATRPKFSRAATNSSPEIPSSRVGAREPLSTRKRASSSAPAGTRWRSGSRPRGISRVKAICTAARRSKASHRARARCASALTSAKCRRRSSSSSRYPPQRSSCSAAESGLGG